MEWLSTKTAMWAEHLSNRSKVKGNPVSRSNQNVIEEVVRGKRIVMVDDSIVRENYLKKYPYVENWQERQRFMSGSVRLRFCIPAILERMYRLMNSSLPIRTQRSRSVK